MSIQYKQIRCLVEFCQTVFFLEAQEIHMLQAQFFTKLPIFFLGFATHEINADFRIQLSGCLQQHIEAFPVNHLADCQNHMFLRNFQFPAQFRGIV